MRAHESLLDEACAGPRGHGKVRQRRGHQQNPGARDAALQTDGGAAAEGRRDRRQNVQT